METEEMKGEKSGIKIGWSSVDITPEKTSDLRGQFHVRIAERVNDPLYATALALESDEGVQAVMVTIDAAGIRDSVIADMRTRLADLDDLDPDTVTVSATHTHSAPSQIQVRYPPQGPDVMKPEEYGTFLAERLTQVVTEAWKGRKPGGIGFGYTSAFVGCNRRMTKFSGESVMYGNTNTEDFSHIEGDEDHTVNILTAYNSDDELTGVVLNIACPSQVTESDTFISADYWHEVREEIWSRLGKGIFILPQCSAAGDQSPHLLIGRKAEARMLHLKSGVPVEETERSTLEMRIAHRAELGRRVADALDAVLPVIAKDIRTEMEFEHQAVTVDLPKRMVSEAERDTALEQVELHKKNIKTCDQDPADRDYSRNYYRIRYFQNVVDRFDEQKDEPVLPMEMHVIRIGDIAFATNRFELFLDFGQRIKARSPATQTFVVQLTGEGTYLPTQRAVDAQSYGAGIESNLVGPEGGQVLVEETLKIIDRMWDLAGVSNET
jgi:hypothetical protein